MLGGAWNAENTILFGSPAGIYSVSAEGGTPELVVPRGEKETGLYWPHFLPDGRRFLYLSWSARCGQPRRHGWSLDSPERTPILAARVERLVHRRRDTWCSTAPTRSYAQPFDAETLKLSGEPTRIAAQVGSMRQRPRRVRRVSRRRARLWPGGSWRRRGRRPGRRLWQLAWIDRSGQEIGKVGSYRCYRAPKCRRMVQRIALHRHDETGGDVWIIEPQARSRG